ncbi:MAG TPA: hypothetical protein VGR27_14435, partial [Longimicrobiaceae bacterium]|nr:hypothetical protein [Longimicrobiaceae bacterium]
MSTILHTASAHGRVPSAAAQRLLGAVRSAWARAALLRGVVLASALLVTTSLALVLLDLLLPLAAAAREVLRLLPPLCAGGVLLVTAIRVARPPGAWRLALLAEERLPELENRLLTALNVRDQGPVARAFWTEAESRLAAADPRRVAPFRLRVPLLMLGSALATGAFLVLLFPAASAEAWDRWLHPSDSYESAWQEIRSEVVPGAPAAPAAPAFAELRWSIRPPAYTGQPERRLRDEELISALPGSRIRVQGRQPGRGSVVRATLIGGGALSPRKTRGEWSLEWSLAAGERGLALEALSGDEVVARRVVPLVAEVDQPPEVALRAPEEDMVLASPAVHIPVRASASDDHGIGDFRLTWIRTSGSGESFSFAEGELQWSALRREGSTVHGEHALDLQALGMKPGDVLHVRAVARDRNTVTGPGEGASPTRVIRIALPEELHTVTTFEGSPLKGEENPLLSQRMLIIVTERLRDRAARIGHEATTRAGTEIAYDQGRLRSRVGEQIFTRSVGAMQDPNAPITFEETGGQTHGHAGEEEHREAHSPEEVLEAASAATGTGRPEEQVHRHDEAPIIDVNRTLLQAYNAMFEAERFLQQGEPAAALPHQHVALRILQQMQEGERRYARGEVRVQPVDVAEARGTGKIDDAQPASRTAAPAAPSARPLLAEMERAVSALESRSPQELSLELSALAARLLADGAAEPAAAALVSRAADALRSGRGAEA